MKTNPVGWAPVDAPKVEARLVELRFLNYRALESARLRLDPITYVLGRNGAGKSSLLDGVVFLRDAMTDGLPNALDRRGGLQGVRRRGAPATASLGLALRFEVSVLDRNFSVLYGVRLGPGAHDIEEVFSASSSASETFHRTGADFESNREITPNVPADRLVLPLIAGSSSIWTAVEAAIKNLRTYDLLPARIAEPTDVGPGLALDRDGGNAADVAKVVFEDDRARHEIRDTLRALHPAIEDIQTRVAFGKRYLVFFIRDEIIREYAGNEVSHGMLRSLGVLLALYQKPEPSLVMIDELENSIHHAALGALAEAIDERARRFPVVLTSHSPELLSAHLEPRQVRIVAWSGGVSRVFPLSAATIGGLDPVTTLGDLFRHNALFPAAEPDALQDDLLEIGS